MTSLYLALLGWIPFVQPLKLPPGARLWMFPPLALCVALVYRATRTRTARDLPKATAKTFLSIVIGMCLLAAAAYALSEGVVRLDGG